MEHALRALVLALALTGPAGAQAVSSCPAGLKLAAGACVRICPGGYEDRGRVCIYRNQSR